MKNPIPLVPLARIAVSTNEAARIASISRSRLYEFMNNGHLPFIKIGTRRIILIRDLDNFLVEARETATQLVNEDAR